MSFQGAIEVDAQELLCDMNSETRYTPAPVHPKVRLVTRIQRMAKYLQYRP